MRNSRNSGLTFSALLSVCAVAHASLNATAAPQSSLKRDGQPGRRGLISAQASLREDVGRLVVVGDDHVDAALLELPDPDVGADPVVDRDDHAGRLLRGQEVRDRLLVERVPVLGAVGDVPGDVRAGEPEEVDEDDGADHAVDVVVAVDQDALALADGSRRAAPRPSRRRGASPGPRGT